VLFAHLKRILKLDRLPVTVRFARMVGDILTMGSAKCEERSRSSFMCELAQPLPDHHRKNVTSSQQIGRLLVRGRYRSGDSWRSMG
jgi:hypothetical protein